MMEVVEPWSKQKVHPYKAGNYRSLDKEHLLADVQFSGTLPDELAASLYARNGGSASERSMTEDLPFHWFDGHGSLAGVYFSVTSKGSIQPQFVNRFLLTDIYLHSQLSKGRRPVLPSVATLLGSLRDLPVIMLVIFRSIVLVFLSLLSPTPIKRLSAANTSVLYHDGRALATCESGPPLWIRLPTMDTVDWYNFPGHSSEDSLRGTGGLTGMVNEWTTAHPKKDPANGELILFHSSFFPPYLKYSVMPENGDKYSSRIMLAPVPIPAARMMHDFAVSKTRSIMLDCPLSLDPLNLARGQSVVNYSPSLPSRFGVLPRYRPDQVRWFEHDSCIIFHTANAWDDSKSSEVHLLACRMNSSTLVYAAGNLDLPKGQPIVDETCQLYYYSFELDLAVDRPKHAFPLSKIAFEFPEVSRRMSMEAARYVYGCSMSSGSFSAALGKAAKIDCLVKLDVLALIEKGRHSGNTADQPVDRRSNLEILATQKTRSQDALENESIRVFQFPPLHYAQECSFVPRKVQRGEDDGYLLTYIFDESQLDENGEASATAKSELWIIDAWNMHDVVAKVHLPQRVPYGLHGDWFSPEEVASQRPIPSIRSLPSKSIRNGYLNRFVQFVERILD